MNRGGKQTKSAKANGKRPAVPDEGVPVDGTAVAGGSTSSLRRSKRIMMVIVFLFVGGFTSRAILDKIGSAGALGVASGAGLRFVITLCQWWFLIPAKKAK